MCCKKCAVDGHRKHIRDFLAFTDMHEEKLRREEDDKFFADKLERLEWRTSHRKTT